MAGETGTEFVGMASRTAEGSLKVFIELLRFLREAQKERYDNKIRKSTINDNRLRQERGLVSTGELVKIANLKNTAVNALPEKLSRKQQERFVEYARSMGLPCSIIMRNSKGVEIRECENRLKELESKGNEIKNKEKEILKRRTEYCREVDESDGVYSDRVLKDFDNQLKTQRDKYINRDFLSEDEKNEYNDLKEQLNGNPAKGIKGLYNEHNEASIQYLAKDAATVEYIIDQLNSENSRENLGSKISELEEKERNGTITPDEKDLLEAAKNKDKEIQEQADKAFNEKSKEEIYQDIKNEVEQANVKMDFKNAIDHDIKNSSPEIGECTFIFDPDNPNNYIKSIVVEEKNGENDRVVREYEVYKDGQLQQAEPVFGTQGKFTDRYTRTVDGEYRFTDKDGNDVSKDENGRYPKGCKMYWNRLKDDMQNKAGITGKSLYVFRSEQEFEKVRTAYNEYINEAEKTGKDKNGKPLVVPMETTAYDIKERLPALKEEIERISSKIYSCDDKIYNAKEIIDKLGDKGYTYNSAEHAFNERISGEKISLDTLKEKGVKDMKVNGEMTSLALYYAGTNIDSLIEIGKVQDEYNDLASKVNKDLKEIEENPNNLNPAIIKNMRKNAENDMEKLKALANKKDILIAKVERNDCKLRNIDIENNGSYIQAKDERSDRQNIMHDSLDEKDINNTTKTLVQWEEITKETQKAKISEQGGNEQIKIAEKHIDKGDR